MSIASCTTCNGAGCFPNGTKCDDCGGVGCFPLPAERPSDAEGEKLEPVAYTDRELLELFRMLLHAQIREERINSIEELRGMLRHVEAALRASLQPSPTKTGGADGQ
jgi:hypothetical protein